MTADLLIDSSILIDHLRGKPAAINFLNSTLVAVGLTTNAVVVAEVLSGARNLREQKEIDRLISYFHVESISASDIDLSLSYLRQYRLSNGTGWHDCLIAATARRFNTTIATLNERHFTHLPGIRVNRPY